MQNVVSMSRVSIFDFGIKLDRLDTSCKNQVNLPSVVLCKDYNNDT